MTLFVILAIVSECTHMVAVTSCGTICSIEKTHIHHFKFCVYSFRRPVISQVDGPSRPRTAEPRQSHPIWLGGSGPERTHSPGKRFINQNSRFAPFAYHEGSPG